MFWVYFGPRSLVLSPLVLHANMLSFYTDTTHKTRILVGVTPEHKMHFMILFPNCAPWHHCNVFMLCKTFTPHSIVSQVRPKSLPLRPPPPPPPHTAPPAPPGPSLVEGEHAGGHRPQLTGRPHPATCRLRPTDVKLRGGVGHGERNVRPFGGNKCLGRTKRLALV